MSTTNDPNHPVADQLATNPLGPPTTKAPLLTGDMNTVTIGDTTNFKSEIPIKEAPSYDKREQVSFQNTLEDHSKHAIEQFLKRPYKWRSDYMNTTQAAGEYIWEGASFPSVTFDNAMYAQKMRGFFAIKGTAKIRVQVNASRFQAGRLLLYYVPTPNYRKYGKLAGDLYNTTQLPKVELDLATETEMTMEIPFIAPWSHSIIPKEGSTNNRADFDWARASLQIYCPLQDPAAGQVSVTTWLSYSNVELVMPAYAQAGGPHKVSIKRRNGVSLNPEETEQDPEDTEGVISRPLRLISKASGTLAMIPALTSVAGPVSWATGILAKTASSFGYSKPFDDAHSTVKQSVMHHNANVDGNITGHTMALTCANKIAHISPFAGTGVDELAFDNLLTKSSYLRTMMWNVSNVDNDELSVIPMSPLSTFHLYCSKVENNWSYPNVRSTRGPVVFHMAEMFRYFNGGFKLKLKFVKTEFHSGRLEIGFNPQLTGSETTKDIDMQWLHRDVVDIRGINEYEIDIPYVSPYPYVPVEKAYGAVVIRVLNRLVAPTTVSQTVPVILELSALPNFEFAVPSNAFLFNSSDDTDWDNLAPTIVNQMAGDVPYSVPPKTRLVNSSFSRSQAGPPGPTPADARDLKTGDTLGTMSNKDSDLTSATCSVGERILSVRQLIKRPTMFGYRELGNVLSDKNNLCIDDVTLPASWTELPTGHNNYPLLNYFSNWFAYRRGGTIVRVNPIDVGVFGTSYGVITALKDGANRYPFDTSDKNESTRVSTTGLYSFERTDLAGSTDVRVPYYRRLPFISTDPPSQTSAHDPTYNRLVVGARAAGSASNTVRIDLYRSAADDYDLGFFISTGYTAVCTDAKAYDKAGPQNNHTSTYAATNDVNIVSVAEGVVLPAELGASSVLTGSFELASVAPGVTVPVNVQNAKIATTADINSVGENVVVKSQLLNESIATTTRIQSIQPGLKFETNTNVTNTKLPCELTDMVSIKGGPLGQDRSSIRTIPVSVWGPMSTKGGDAGRIFPMTLDSSWKNTGDEYVQTGPRVFQASDTVADVNLKGSQISSAQAIPTTQASNAVTNVNIKSSEITEANPIPTTIRGVAVPANNWLPVTLKEMASLNYASGTKTEALPVQIVGPESIPNGTATPTNAATVSRVRGATSIANYLNTSQLV